MDQFEPGSLPCLQNCFMCRCHFQTENTMYLIKQIKMDNSECIYPLPMNVSLHMSVVYFTLARSKLCFLLLLFFYCKFNSDHFSPKAVHSFKAQSYWYETLSHKSDLHKLYNFYFISLGHKHSILIGNCLARKMHFSRIRYHRLSRGQYFPMVLINPFFFAAFRVHMMTNPRGEKKSSSPLPTVLDTKRLLEEKLSEETGTQFPY